MYLGDWLTQWAELDGERLALLDAAKGRRLTYAQLNDRAARLAGVLKERCGVTPGDRVALIAMNGSEIFEALFACAKLGAAFVPLNWRLAPKELVGIVRDCAPQALIYGPAWAHVAEALLSDGGVTEAVAIADKVRSEDLDYEASLAEATPAATHQVGQEDLAMILYTSGTTGLPKGVMLSWRQVVFNSINTTIACDLTKDDRCLAFLPLFHTGGINCLATPLFHRGGAVVLMQSFDAEVSLELMEAHDVTCTVAVPVMYQMLIDAGLGERELPKLTTLLCGGAPCPHELIRAYLELGYNFRQGYGLTEVGPNCFSLHPGDVGSRIGSVGRPIFHSLARVVDDAGEDVAPGEIGELWLKGPHVTLGYWNKPEATAKVLDAAGWFHTGDFVKRDAENYFYIAGRKKEMFISGGENVYPAEVENALASHPDVAEVAVVGVKDARWGEVGAAALVARAGAEAAGLEAGALKAWTRERLASYKVPKHWKVVEALPRNSSGKVLKADVKAMF